MPLRKELRISKKNPASAFRVVLWNGSMNMINKNVMNYM